jgi:2',3'-cyclic-nucleotide 2'-phosphodiesterase/3'-nucleotidase
MKMKLLSGAIILVLSFPLLATDGDIHDVTILGKSNIHGHFMVWHYASDKVITSSSLSQITTKVKAIRKEQENLIIVDAGILSKVIFF